MILARGFKKLTVYNKKTGEEIAVITDDFITTARGEIVVGLEPEEHDHSEIKGGTHMEKFYIIRADRAGVFFGHIKERRGSEVDMTNVRRIWRWSGARTLTELAKDGPSDPRDCQFTEYIDEMTILGVIEVIPCSDMAVDVITGVEPWMI